jgi:hypothetical protein
MPWTTPFHVAISLPDGRRIATLNDAAHFIKTLPIATQHLPRWQFTVEMLINAAEHGWPLMVADVAFTSALRNVKSPSARL